MPGKEKLTLSRRAETPNLLANVSSPPYLGNGQNSRAMTTWLSLATSGHALATTTLNLAAVAVGGAGGAVGRYVITLAAASVPGGSSAWGTTITNVVGCGLMGALVEYAAVEEVLSARMLLAVRVGFLGGLTTFSTFAAESAAFAESGRAGAAALYVAANLLIGWAALFFSAMLVRGWIT